MTRSLHSPEEHGETPAREAEVCVEVEQRVHHERARGADPSHARFTRWLRATLCLRRTIDCPDDRD
jgi:hypothetical protein